jgi:pilus assembly protein Flp/PilA
MSILRNTLALRLALALQGNTMAALKREEGQTLAEYALILALIAAVVVGVVVILGNTISGIFSKASSAI